MSIINRVESEEIPHFIKIGEPQKIRLWGLDAQKRLRAAKVCVFGLDSLGSEIVKNLVLAGIDQMTLVDNRKPDEKVSVR